MSLIDDRLRTTRRRWIAVFTLRSALGAVACGGAVVALLAVGRVWHPWSAESVSPTFALQAGGVAVIAVLLMRAYLGTVWLPSNQRIARQADLQFALEERVSSALSVRESSSPSRFRTVLLRDAERHADRIDPSVLVPHGGRGLPLVALALTLAAGVSWFLPVPDGPGPPVQDVEPMPATLDLETVADDARRLSELIELEPDTAPYVEAVGRAFADLADRIESRTIDRARAEQELRQLLEGFADALAREASNSELASALATFVTPPPPNTGEDDQAAAPGAELPPQLPGVDVMGQEPTSEAERRQGASFSASPARALEELRARLEERQIEREALAAELGTQAITEPDLSGAYFEANPELLAELEERRRLLGEAPTGPGQVAVGGATESTDAPGDLAGEGTAPLAEGAPSPTLDPTDGAIESVALPGQARDDGDTVRVEVAPTAEYVDVDQIRVEGDRPWERGALTADPSTIPALAYRAAVARYFLPDSASEASSP